MNNIQYPKHIKSGLLNDLLAAYRLRTVAGNPPHPSELSKRHQDYQRQLLRHYEDQLVGVRYMRYQSYLILAELAAAGDDLTPDERARILMDRVHPTAPIVLQLSDAEVVLVLAGEERNAIRAALGVGDAA